MKKYLFLFLSISILVIACNNNQKTKSSEQTNQEVTINPEKVVMADMDVTGMTCTGCENTIKSGVSELNGVVEVTADYQNGKTMVKYDSSLVTIEEISEMISSKGYAVAGKQIK